jgi:hypothetical protein
MMRETSARTLERVKIWRAELDLGEDLVFLEALVALKDDAVDDRVFLDLNGHRARVVADLRPRTVRWRTGP